MPRKKVKEVKAKAKISTVEKIESKKIISLEASLNLKSEEALSLSEESRLSAFSKVRQISDTQSTNLSTTKPQQDNNREFSLYDIQRQRESVAAESKRSYAISMVSFNTQKSNFQGRVSRLTRNSEELTNQDLKELSDEKERPYDASLRADTTRAQKKLYPWEM